VGTFVGQPEIEKCYAGVFQRFGTLSDQVDKIAHLYNFYSEVCGFTTYSNNVGGGVRSIIYTPEGDTWKIRMEYGSKYQPGNLYRGRTPGHGTMVRTAKNSSGYSLCGYP
jgi:hypothetical protein